MAHIAIIGTTYPAPNWGPIEHLLKDTPEVLDAVMYMGQVQTTAGVGHVYKHDQTRRTLYLLPEITAQYHAPEKGQPHLVPFATPAEALIWWQS